MVFCMGRRVLIFPKGNNVDHLSMYLDVADSSTLPYGWSRYAQFSLAVVNQIHNKFTVRKGKHFITLLIMWKCEAGFWRFFSFLDVLYVDKIRKWK